jgi:uncharacterized protein YndB with AHSA1/START domain
MSIGGRVDRHESERMALMKSANLTYSFLVDRSPEEAFAAINDVRGWWSGNIEGKTDQLGAEWTYRYEDLHYSKQKVTELVPGKKIVWEVIDSRLGFVADKHEWNDTTITFELAKKGRKTEVRFSHLGLTPDVECYDDCSSAWRSYITGSLKNLITKGKGQPNAPA